MSKEKILFLGLNNSGKTSIVISLQKTTNLLSYTSLKPTKGIERTQFEDKKTEFNIWDFGGQEKYRREHLERLPDYIAGTDKIIYVIDIQDEKRYVLAVEYLGKIIKILQSEKYMVKLSIFLHKFDTNYEIDEDTLIGLVNIIEEKIPNNYNHDISKTTIFTVFKKDSL